MHYSTKKDGRLISFKRLCVVTLLKEYLSRTAPTRGEHSQLFLSDARPFSPVLRDSISRWVKTVMEQAD